MDFDEMLALTPEEFAKSWNNNDDIIDCCLEVIEDGVKKFNATRTNFEL